MPATESMFYLDTSILIPYLITEPETPAVELLLSSLQGRIAVSGWTQVEFTSALAKKVRARECPLAGFHKTLSQLEQLNTSFFVRLPVGNSDFDAAKKLLLHPALGLRSGDALHLAIAQSQQATLLTLDKLLLKAARHYKIAAETIGVY